MATPDTLLQVLQDFSASTLTQYSPGDPAGMATSIDKHMGFVL